MGRLKDATQRTKGCSERYKSKDKSRIKKEMGCLKDITQQRIIVEGTATATSSVNYYVILVVEEELFTPRAAET